MIFYYSGTGNTRYAAGIIGSRLNEDIKDLLRTEEGIDAPEPGEAIGIMFPIYCWGIPPVVWSFMEKLFPLLPSHTYVWAACTCGDETGTAMKRFDNLLRKRRGRRADALFSVIMPNTYVMLPGFDVDSKQIEKEKLSKAPERLDNIAGIIKNRTSGIYDVHEGSLPALRSSIFPLFKRWGVDTKWWKVSEKCIGCGKCSKICPARNIEMASDRPVWGANCYSCCACFHCCPVNAISYASFTKGKLQYLCPL